MAAEPTSGRQAGGSPAQSRCSPLLEIVIVVSTALASTCAPASSRCASTRSSRVRWPRPRGRQREHRRHGGDDPRRASPRSSSRRCPGTPGSASPTTWCCGGRTAKLRAAAEPGHRGHARRARLDDPADGRRGPTSGWRAAAWSSPTAPSTTPPSAPSPPRSARSPTSPASAGARGGRPRLAQYRAPELDELDSGEVDAVNGAFMLVRDTALEQVGPLDEGYWLYMDDLDWCYRFKQTGWKVWYDGSVTCIHVKGGTTVEARRSGRHRGLKHNLAFHRSMGRFYRKFYAGQRPPVDVLIYTAIMGKFVIAAVRSTIARKEVVLECRHGRAGDQRDSRQLPPARHPGRVPHLARDGARADRRADGARWWWTTPPATSPATSCGGRPPTPSSSRCRENLGFPTAVSEGIEPRQRRLGPPDQQRRGGRARRRGARCWPPAARGRRIGSVAAQMRFASGARHDQLRRHRRGPARDRLRPPARPAARGQRDRADRGLRGLRRRGPLPARDARRDRRLRRVLLLRPRRRRRGVARPDERLALPLRAGARWCIHHHGATIGHGSSLKYFHVGLNRVRTLAKNADSGQLRRHGPADDRI